MSVLIVGKSYAPFYVVEAIASIKDYLHIEDSVDNIIKSAEKISSDGIEIYDDTLEIIVSDVKEIPTVKNAINSNDYKELIEKSILVLIDRLDENQLKRIELCNGITEVVDTIESKLGVRFKRNVEKLLVDVISNKMNPLNPIEEVPNYTDKVIFALTALENAIKDQNKNINQNELNKVLRLIGASAYEVDSFGESVIDNGAEEEDSVVDESSDDLFAKNRKVVRNGKVITIKKRKKKMSSSTRNKIARAMKKVKRRIKPSTIKKMLKSRAIREKRGL